MGSIRSMTFDGPIGYARAFSRTRAVGRDAKMFSGHAASDNNEHTLCTVTGRCMDHDRGEEEFPGFAACMPTRCNSTLVDVLLVHRQEVHGLCGGGGKRLSHCYEVI